jgi:hypothetical protein
MAVVWYSRPKWRYSQVRPWPARTAKSSPEGTEINKAPCQTVQADDSPCRTPNGGSVPRSRAREKRGGLSSHEEQAS